MFEAAARAGGLAGAARLLPRPRRGAGLALGGRRGRAQAADDRHRLPRRADPDRPGARACRARGGEAAGGGAGLCRRRDGGGVDRLCDLAGARSALRGTRAFMFHEGRDPVAARAFREIARLTRGAYLPFDARAAGELAGAARRGRGLGRRRPAGARGGRHRRGAAAARGPLAMTLPAWSRAGPAGARRRRVLALRPAAAAAGGGGAAVRRRPAGWRRCGSSCWRVPLAAIGARSSGATARG